MKLASTYRFSGYRSVELRDAAGDGDFPELQGYFAPRHAGRLFAHFAMLTTDADDLLNVAVAGPKWFTLAKDGIGFWLKSEGGFLWHVSDSMPQRLFPLRAFVWYVVDVAYDIDRGVYDLTIREEGKPARSSRSRTSRMPRTSPARRSTSSRSSPIRSRTARTSPTTSTTW